MRRKTGCALMMTLCLMLTACGGNDTDEVDQLILDVRGFYLAMEHLTAAMTVEADYGQRVYDYNVELSWQRDGETVITITAPEEVAGITAKIADGTTELIYDGLSLETGTLDESGLTPMGAGPYLLRQAVEGFIAEGGWDTLEERTCLRVLCRDPEGRSGEGTECSLWFDRETNALLRGEISVDGRRVISCQVTEFLPQGGDGGAA